MLMSMLFNAGACPCCLAFMPAGPTASRFVADAPGATADRAAARPHVYMPRSGRVRLFGGTIVNPGDGSLTEGMSILLDGGRIVSIDSTEKPGPSAQSIDISGKFVVPGYNDMHNHALNLEDPSGSLALMLVEGVTGFRQMSGTPARLQERRDRTLPVGKDAPALLELPGSVLFPINAGSGEAVVNEIRAQKQQGADFIKVAVVNPAEFHTAMAEAARVGLPILGHVQRGVDVAEATRAGFRSVEHLGPGDVLWIKCSTAEPALQAEAAARPPLKLPPMKIPFLRRFIMRQFAKLLINPAAFASPVDVDRLRRAQDSFSEQKCQAMAEGFVTDGSWHVPTLVRLRQQELADSPEHQNDPYVKYMPAANIKLWRGVTAKFKKLPAAMRATYAEAYPKQLQMTGLLAAAGVRMMTGSDGGSMMAPGLTLQQEFVELAKAGLSPLKILQMTTINAAEYLHRTDTMGTVTPGNNADLVLLDANPLDDVANFSRIAGVVRAGFYYSRQDLDALKGRVAAGHGYLQ